MSAQPTPETRLTADVRPTHYALIIRVDLEASTFVGRADIDLDVVTDTHTLEFNSTGLDLSSVKLLSSTQEQLTHESQELDVERGRVTLVYPTALRAGAKLRLRVAYTGVLASDGKGLYASGGCVLTQLQPDAASRVFPCWDEPAIKASVALTLITRADSTCISTMPAAAETSCASDGDKLSELMTGLTVNEWKTTRFTTTPPMSMNTPAWATGTLAHVERISPSKESVTLRIYGAPGSLANLDFALDVLAKALPVYEQILDMSYPLPKLDILLVEGFDDGVLETSWGLIVGPSDGWAVAADAPDAAKRAVASTICQALAKQWFGTLVSLAWWDTLYLNVGMASLLGAFVVPARLFPEWDASTAFGKMYTASALMYDGKRSARALEGPTPSAAAADGAFDALQWTKSGAVLHMLRVHVGEEVLLRGVRAVLKEHTHGSAGSAELWDKVSEAAGRDVRGMMKGWTTQAGFPCLTVTETSTGISVRQARFIDTGAGAVEEDALWEVPLDLHTSDGTVKQDLVLTSREMKIPLDTSKAYKLNASGINLVRVSYPVERLKLLASEPGIMSDAAALARAGFLPTSAALALADALRHDTQPQVWDALSAFTASVRDVWFEHVDVVAGVLAFRRALFGTLVEQLGLEPREGEDAADAQLRAMAITGAAGSEDPVVVEDLERRFAAFMRTGDDAEIPETMRSAAYAVGVRRGGRAEFDAVRARVTDASTQGAKAGAAVALCAAPEQAWVREALVHALEHARTQDIETLVYGASANAGTRRMMAEFFMEHYEEFAKRFGGSMTFQHVVRDAFVRLSSADDADRIEAFFADRDTRAFAGVLRQTLDTVRSAAAWIERSTEDVREWMKEREGK